MKILNAILWLPKILLMICGWVFILMTWPISVPWLLIQRSKRRHAELMAAIERR